MRVLMVAGGPSPEHVASIESALGVLEHSETLKGTLWLIPCVITKDGQWLDSKSSGRALEEYQKEGFEGYEAKSRGCGGSLRPWQILQEVDIVFPVMHGAYGEDGVLLGLCEAMKKPFVGCDILSSVVCLDKVTCNSVLKQAGLPQTPLIIVLPGESTSTGGEAERKALALPWIVKPSQGGCSVGVELVHSSEHVSAAIGSARKEYPNSAVLIETAVLGRMEIDVAVMQDPDGSLLVSPGGLRENFDHKSFSSASGGTREPPMGPRHNQGDVPAWVVPAPGVPGSAIEEMQSIAKKVFRLVRATAFLRVDFFYKPAEVEGLEDLILINEINTIPSLARGCMFYKLLGALGITPSEFIKRAVDLAMKRKTIFSEHTTSKG
jgi:D-alanine-D-alanine ligase